MIEKKPFVKYEYDDEDNKKKTKREIISVSLNVLEREMLNEFKRNAHIHLDSTALKVLATVGANVIHNHLGRTVLKYLTSRNRPRYLQE